MTRSSRRRHAGVLTAFLVLSTLVITEEAAAASCFGMAPTMRGTAGGDTLNGGPGDDVIDAGGGADTIDGGGGFDRICGGDGDDTIDAGFGADRVDGGPGADTISYASFTTPVIAHLGIDGRTGASIESTGRADVLKRVENLTGTPSQDFLAGGPGPNVIDGGDGNDHFIYYMGDRGNATWIGGAGDDTAQFQRAAGPLNVDLAAGSATLGAPTPMTFDFDGIEDVWGTFFHDVMSGSESDNGLVHVAAPGWVFDGSTMTGLGGNDVLSGGPGGVTGDGGEGDDDVWSNGYNPATLNGGPGNDTVYQSSTRYDFDAPSVQSGGPGHDELFGGTSADQMNGDDGDDDLEGGAGDDELNGGAGENDVGRGGSGTDVCVSIEYPSFDCNSPDGDDRVIGDPVPAGPEADLNLAASEQRSTKLGEEKFVLTVTNDGPDSTPPSKLRFYPGGRVVAFEAVSGDPVCRIGKDQGNTYERDLWNTELLCTLGELSAQQAARVQVRVRPGAVKDALHTAVAMIDPVAGAPRDPDWSNNVRAIGGDASCPADPPALDEVDLTQRELAEVLRDQRNNMPLAEWRETLEQAIAEVEQDTIDNPSHKAENDEVVAELQALLDEVSARRVSAGRLQDGGLTPEQQEILQAAGCRALSDANAHLNDYLRSNGYGDHSELFTKLLQLKEILRGDPMTESDKEEYLKKALEDLVSRLAKDKLDEKATDRLKTRLSLTVSRSYKVLVDYLEGDLNKEKFNHIQGVLEDAADVLDAKDAKEFVTLAFTFRKVIAGEASEEEQYTILKETVANLANRLTTKLFGTAILSTPHARAAMIGFEIGLSLGERIARDLELIFQGSLVNDCTETLVDAQGANGPADVRYNEAATAFVTNEVFWHVGWQCTIVDIGFVESTAGGIVQATRPEDAPLRLRIVWRATTGGRNVIYWDPACALRRSCGFSKS